MSITKKIFDFFNRSIWTYAPAQKSLFSTIGLKYLRIMLASAFKFYKDDSFVTAASLTYYSINSMVPILALFLWLATHFALAGNFSTLLIGLFPESSESIQTLFSYSKKMLSLMSSGLFIVIGVGLLIWSVFVLMNNIEKAINGIWSFTKERPLGKRFILHFIVVCSFPFIISLSVSANIAIKESVINMINDIGILTDWLTRGVHFAFIFSSYILSACLFTMLFKGFPHRRVSWKSALFAGLVAGLLFFLFERLYINSQIGVSRMHAIYGGLAALPLFLLWLDISWIIILYGVHLSYHIENYPAFTPPSEEKLSIVTFKKLCIAIYRFVEKKTKQFPNQAGVAHRSIARQLLTSIYQLDNALMYLCDSGLIQKTSSSSTLYTLTAISPTAQITDEEIEQKIESLYSNRVVLVDKKS